MKTGGPRWHGEFLRSLASSPTRGAAARFLENVVVVLSILAEFADAVEKTAEEVDCKTQTSTSVSRFDFRADQQVDKMDSTRWHLDRVKCDKIHFLRWVRKVEQRKD